MNKIPSAQELTKLYVDNKLSLSGIAIKLNISIHKVRYWMSKYQIPKRSQSDAVYLKLNPYGEPFKIKNRLTRNEVKLKYLALGLYWGEGNKVSNYKNWVTNSDPGVIIQFQKYLKEICQAKDTKIHYYLQTFKDNDIYLAKEYWSKQLSIDPDRINTGKPIHSMGKGSYKRISSYGVMSINFSNIHLKSYIMGQLAKLGVK